ITTSDGTVIPIGIAKNFQKSEWTLQPIFRTEDHGEIVWTYQSTRPTNFRGNWAAGAAPLPVTEVVQAEYRRKRKANLEITGTVEPTESVFAGTIAIQLTVKNLGPDESRDGKVALTYQLRNTGLDIGEAGHLADTGRYEIVPMALDQGSVLSRSVNEVRFDLGNLSMHKSARFVVEVRDYSVGYH